MTYFLFFYSIFLTLAFGICGFGFLVIYLRDHSRRDLWIAVMFLIFTCDNLLYSVSEMVPEFFDFYQRVIMATPFPNNLVTVFMVFSYRMVIAYEFDAPPSKTEKLLYIFIFAVLMAATGFAQRLAGRLIFHLLIQVCMAAILTFAFRGLAARREDMGARPHRLWLGIIIMSTATHLIGAVERLVFILSGRVPLGNRVIGFEAFGVLCAAVALWYLFRYLSHTQRSFSDEDLMELFISRHKLTPREAELVPLLLRGASNAEICEELFISLGTVKVHTHNIYSKLGIERRSQMAATYAQFTASHKGRP